MTYPKIIIVASHVPILAAAVLAAVLFRRLQRPGRIFSAFIGCSCLIQMISLGWWFMHRNNMPFLHIYVPLGFACLAWFYTSVLSGYIDTRIIVAPTVLFVLYSILNSIFLQPVLTFNSYALTVESILVLILSIFTFVVQLDISGAMGKTMRVQGLGWINSGLFIYYASTLLLFYFGTNIMQRFSVNISAYAWMYHSFFSTIMYLFFIIGLCRQSTRSR